MSYNILEDENSWKISYKKYIEKLSTDELLHELKYITKTHKNFRDTYSSDFINSYEEIYDMKVRIEIICEVIKDKLDSVNIKPNIIYSEQEYKEMQLRLEQQFCEYDDYNVNE